MGLTSEASQLLRAAVQSGGMIMRLEVLSGVIIQTDSDGVHN